MNNENSVAAKLEKLKALKKGLERSYNTPTSEDTTSGSTTPSNLLKEPIAIVGMHGYLPGAMDLREYWKNLEQGTSVISEVPADRFDWRDYYDPTGEAGMQTKWGGFIPNIRNFDPTFFGVIPDEADMLDPQQRLLLMSTYKTIEDAGYAPESFKKSNTGVYIGIEDNEYVQYLKDNQSGLGPNAFNHHPSMAANRLSYFFDLRGPSEIVNTMCASAAVAIHRASNAIRQGEIRQAIVGAARIILKPEYLAELVKLNVVSKSHQPKSFGDGADGYVRSEGVATILLKPLSAAERDGDAIYGIIRSSATNYNGRGGMSIAAPNIESHTQVIADCYRQASIDIRDLNYLELQGMGNHVSDIAEWEAANRALELLHQESGSQFYPGACKVSTLKPSIGHMETTSALAALFKVIHSFKANKIFGIVDFDKVNPYLNMDSRPCRLAISDERWEPANKSRLAGIHSFGSGGNNAHLLVEEYTSQVLLKNTTEKCLVPLSSGSLDQLKRQALNLAKALAKESDLRLKDVAYTLQVGRTAMQHRLALVVDSIELLIQQLQEFALNAGEISDDIYRVAQNTAASAQSFDRLDPASTANQWLSGTTIQWQEAYLTKECTRVHLPTYEFKQVECWVTTAEKSAVSPQTTNIPAANTQTATKAISSGDKAKRVCIIGAGPSGLVMAKSLLEEGHVPVVYEKNDQIGGLWVLRENKKAGAYKKTRFQSSRFTSIFSDFDSPSVKSTFFSVDDINRYLNEYVEHFALLPHIHFHSDILQVEPHGAQWKVTVSVNGETRTEVFDGVSMCQGSFWNPSIPKKKGMTEFKGRIMHSAEYLDNSLFAGKKVAVIGSGVSAMDIAEEVSAVAETVYWSKRSTKLILPRMVGFVPNDCQSPASLMIEENRLNIIDRLEYSMPEYYATYKKSGLLPTREEFENNPIVHINETIVDLVVQGKVQPVGDVAEFSTTGCAFTDDSESFKDVDIVVFATGYRDYESEKIRYPFLKGVEVEKDFSMGIFYSKNPTLVTSSVLPIAFTGSFYFMEMTARWYAQILSGNYLLTQEELNHRLSPNHYLIVAPLSILMFGLRLGLFPDPKTEFTEFWRLLNYPSFPMIYRLRGIHKNDAAQKMLDDFKSRSYVKTDNEDPALRELKHRILAGLGEVTMQSLLQANEISEQDFAAARAYLDTPVKLDWDMQYIMGQPKQEEQQSITQQNQPTSMDTVSVEEYVTTALGSMMASILRMDETELDLDKNLSEYGFDSITLTSFAGKIREQFEFVQLSPMLFIDHPNIASLVDYFAKEYADQWQEIIRSESNTRVGTDKTHTDSNTSLPSKLNLEDYRYHKNIEILSTSETGNSAFWFHGAFGTADVYLPLANKMKDKVTFVGIKNNFDVDYATGKVTDQPSVLQMAEAYADLLNNIQGERGFHLGGYSQGGVLAYEVARLLTARGRKVESIVMLDAPYPPVTEDFSESYLKIVTFINILTSNGLEREGDQEFLFSKVIEQGDINKLIVDFAKERGLKYQDSELIRVLEMFYSVLNTNAKAMKAFKLRTPLDDVSIKKHYFSRAHKDRFFDFSESSSPDELVELNAFHKKNNCVKKWQKFDSSIELHVTKAKDHFSLLEEGEILTQIADCCLNLYTDEQEKVVEKA